MENHISCDTIHSFPRPAQVQGLGTDLYPHQIRVRVIGQQRLSTWQGRQNQEQTCGPTRKVCSSWDYLVATTSAEGLVPCIVSGDGNWMNECLFAVTSSVPPELSVTHRCPVKQPFFLLWKNLVSFICHCKGFLKNTILIFRLSEQVKDCFDSQDRT